MYVCLCNGVTDKDIKKSVAAGATSLRELYKELSIGSQCGKCCQCAKKVLNNELLQVAEAQIQAAENHIRVVNTQIQVA